MYCNQCGHENRNDRKFWANCGAPLRDYTKPRENLLMQSDIVEHQENIQKLNNKINNIKIAGIFCFVIAIVLLFITFFSIDIVRLILSIISLVLFIIFVILWQYSSKLQKKKQSMQEKDYE